MIISLLVVIGVLALMFKLTGLVFSFFGKLLGLVFSGIGYFFVGILAIGMIGMAIVIIPLVVIIGISSIVAALT